MKSYPKLRSDSKQIVKSRQFLPINVKENLREMEKKMRDVAKCHILHKVSGAQFLDHGTFEYG